MFRQFAIVAVLFGPTIPSFGEEWFPPSHRNPFTEFAVPDFVDRIAAGSLVGDPSEAQYRDTVTSPWADSADFPECLRRNTESHNSPLLTDLLTNYESSFRTRLPFDISGSGDVVIRGQSPDGGGGESGGGGGAGAAAATDPSVPLAQIQIQNLFTPETYDASGYSNTVIVQPVIPLHIGEDAFFPYHIVRPTLPIISPSADPDGPAGSEGGLGDMTVVDVFIHPSERLKTSFGIGYVATLPTRTDPRLGLGEWQIGPSAVVISRAVPKWIFGGLVEVPFSVESDAYSVQMQGIAMRLLPDECFIGWGDQILKFNDQNGGYDLPLSLQVGKVVKVGNTPMKLFVEPIYTPEGLRSGPGGAEWSIKLNLTILFPDAKLNAPLLGALGNCCGGRDSCTSE